MQDRSCMCRIDPAHTIWFAVTVRVRVRVRVRVNVRARVSGSILYVQDRSCTYNLVCRYGYRQG